MRYNNEGVVCPSKLRRELFTTAAVDNIDHNASSTSSQSSLHGTAISLVKHSSDTENGTTSVVDTFDPKKCSSKTMTELSACYRDVAPMAYRASKTPLSIYKPAIVTLLPMFTENAHSLAMIAHSMKVIKAAVQYLNSLQTPVIALDQPLYALAKQVQWTIPEFDEDKFLAMMGGLHIEMASLKMLGKWLTS